MKIKLIEISKLMACPERLCMHSIITKDIPKEPPITSIEQQKNLNGRLNYLKNLRAELILSCLTHLSEIEVAELMNDNPDNPLKTLLTQCFSDQASDQEKPEVIENPKGPVFDKCGEFFTKSGDGAFVLDPKKITPETNDNKALRVNLRKNLQQDPKTVLSALTSEQRSNPTIQQIIKEEILDLSDSSDLLANFLNKLEDVNFTEEPQNEVLPFFREQILEVVNSMRSLNQKALLDKARDAIEKVLFAGTPDLNDNTKGIMNPKISFSTSMTLFRKYEQTYKDNHVRDITLGEIGKKEPKP